MGQLASAMGGLLEAVFLTLPGKVFRHSKSFVDEVVKTLFRPASPPSSSSRSPPLDAHSSSSSSKYYKSFRVDEVKEYTESFRRDGFVVIDGLLTSDEIKASQEEVWDYLGTKGKVDRKDPQTWGEEHWPKEICRNGGFMGRFPYVRRLYSIDKTFINKQPQAWRNRQNPKVYEVFKNILEAEKLWVSLDRYGIMRPTKLTGGKSGDFVRDKREWKTKKDWLHWDLNPFHYATSAAGFGFNPNVSREEISRSYGWTRVQGLLTITDCPEEVGGFHCVKAFQGKRFFEWRAENMETYGREDGVATRNFVEVPEKDPMRRNVTRVPMRKGSLLVWNSQLPHGNFPNNCDMFRMVHYIKMIPVDDAREFKPILGLDDKRLKKGTFFPPGFTPSELGKKLFGLETWK